MKKILRQKANFVILEGFLTELLRFDVKIIEILESEANQESEDDKFNRVNLLAKNESGELILIEVQYNDEIDYFYKMLYGASNLILKNAIVENDILNIKKVYSITINSSENNLGNDYIYYSKTTFKGLYKQDILTQDKIIEETLNIRTSDIHPSFYLIVLSQFTNQIKDSLDEWIYFLKNEEIKTNFKAKGLNEAKEVLDVLKLDPKERAIYKRKEENRRYKESLFFTTERKGMEIGEKKAKIEIAKNLLDILDIETVSLKTGLTIKEIEEIKKNL